MGSIVTTAPGCVRGATFLRSSAVVHGNGAVMDDIGLCERKKAQTRDAIQSQALRLFRDHGYEATTVQ